MFEKTFDRFKRGMILGREAFGILKAHPKLLVFPIISGSAFIGMLALILAPFFMPGMNLQVLSWLNTFGGFDAAFYAGFALLYFLIAFVYTFFNVALAASVISHDRTGVMSLRHGLGTAVRRLPQVIAWALFAATVGLLLKALTRFMEEYLGWFGSVLGALAEVGFAVATYFVAPVLAVEGIGPFAALKHSAQLIRDKWGQSVGAEFSTMWVLWPLHLFGLLTLVSAYLLKGQAQMIAIGSFLVYVLVSAVVGQVMSSVITSRLFVYARTGQPPRGSDQAIYQGTFARRR